MLNVKKIVMITLKKVGSNELTMTKYPLCLRHFYMWVHTRGYFLVVERFPVQGTLLRSLGWNHMKEGARGYKPGSFLYAFRLNTKSPLTRF